MEKAFYYSTYVFLFFVCVSMISLFTYRTITQENHLKDLEATNYCYRCCIQNNISCVTNDVCRSRFVDPNICGQPENSASSEHVSLYGKDEKIKMIIKDVLDKHASERSHEFAKLNDITRVPKPKAHLAGIGISKRKHPVRTGKRPNEYKNTYWDHRHLINFASPREGMSYDPNTGALTIPQAGKYYVYLHTTFYTDPSNSSKSDTFHISHNVKRHNKVPGYIKEEEDLIHSKEEKSGFTKSTRVHKKGDGKKIKFHTLHSNGVHKLDAGDQLTVYYEMPDSVRISTNNKETHFGAFMI